MKTVAVTINVGYFIGAQVGITRIFATEIKKIPRGFKEMNKLFGANKDGLPNLMLTGGFDSPSEWWHEIDFCIAIDFLTYKGSKQNIRKHIGKKLVDLSTKSGIEYYPSQVL